MQTSFKENNSFFARIMQIIDYKHIKSVNDFAINWLGYDAPQKINRLKDQKNKPSYEIILDIVNKFEEINPEWILTGKGDMLKSQITVNEPKERYPTNMIPVYDVETIGGTSVVANMQPAQHVSEWIDAGDWFPGATAAIRHYEDSMMEYPSGCILALKEVLDRDLIVWGKNYCIETSEYRVTKRIYDDGDIITAYSTNEETYTNGRSIHPPFPIPKKSILKIYRVLGYVVKEYSNGPVMISKQ